MNGGHDAADAFREAAALLSKGKPADAERVLEARWPVRTESSPPPEAIYLRALVRRALGRFGEAAILLRAAIAGQPADARYHFALGDVLAAQDDAVGAFASFEETLRLAPDFPTARLNLARAALALQRLEEAEGAVRAELADAPNAEAWDVLSAVLQAQDRLQEALAAAEMARRLDPNAVSARFNWAVTAGKLGRTEEAVAEFAALTAAGAHASVIVAGHAAGLFQLGRLDEAETVLAQGVMRWPQDVGLHVALAKARWQNGAGLEFSRAFEDAVAKNPAHQDLRAACAQVLRQAGAVERAENVLRNGLMHASSHPALLAELGQVLAESGRLGEASSLLERAAKAAPDAEGVLSDYLMVLLRLGRATEVLQQIAERRWSAAFRQMAFALEALALRQTGDERYHWLCDYDRMVHAFELPTPRGFSSLGAFNSEFARRVGALHVTKAHPLDQSLRKGTQGYRELQLSDDPVIVAYIEALADPIRAYIAQMEDAAHPWSSRKSSKFKFAGVWSVRLKSQGYHVSHVHPAGWISSAYYVQVPDTASDDTAGCLKFGEPPYEVPGCGVEHLVRPEPGRLVLFPSYFWHGTIPIGEGAERMTAPFDVLPETR